MYKAIGILASILMFLLLNMLEYPYENWDHWIAIGCTMTICAGIDWISAP